MRDGTLVDSLRVAARLVATKGAKAITVLSASSPGVSCAMDARHGLMADGELHSHSCVELCFASEGICRMWTPAGSTTLTPEHGVFVIPPHLAHGEGWHRAGEAYRMLWLILVGECCSAFMNSYVPGRGWRANESVSVLGETAAPIARGLDGAAASGAQSADATTGYFLQGGILVLLADLLRESAASEGAAPGDHRKVLVAQIRNYIDLHYAEALSVGALATLFRLSPNHLNSLFSRHEGMGIHAYLLHRRLHVAQRLLAERKRMVKQVAYEVGFSDPLYFSRRFKRRFGCSPSKASR